MATISSSGIGSGLDVNSLVSQLVAAERKAPDARLVREDARLTTEFTALATLKGALSGLQGAVNGLKAGGSLDLRKATVGDDKYFSASVTGKAATGSYDIEVLALARAAQLGSGAFTGASENIGAGTAAGAGTGTLTITLGASSFDVTIDDTNNTLAGIRDAINKAAGSSGVQATLVNNVDGDGDPLTSDPVTRLVLTSSKTGAANALGITATETIDDGDAATGLSRLDGSLFDPIVEAADARVRVSGYEITGTSNTLSGAIDGMTLTLKKVTTEPLTLEVARDDAAIQGKVQSFVTAFNNLANQVKSLGGYNAATKTGGPLLGDSLLRGIDTQVRRMLGERVQGATGAYDSLAALGITTTSTGTLELNAEKFKAALQADPQAVDRVFASENGVAAKLGKYLDERLSATGELAARDSGITSRRKRLEQDSQALEARMAVIEQRYVKQFTALDAMLGQLQSTSSYLTTQLSSLAKIGDN
jgi:flagellar hook-associated protein 2